MLDFDSFTFFANLFAILLVLLPVYRVTRSVTARRLLLALVGLYLLWVIAPRLALFYLVYWTVVLGLQRVQALIGERRGSAWLLGAGIVLLLAPMVTWKTFTEPFVLNFNLVGNDVLRGLSERGGAIDMAKAIVLPLGLSFSTFRAIDLLIKTFLGVFDGLRPDEVLFYGLFPPVLMIGPVIQYTEIQRAVEPGRTVVWDDLRAGLLLVVSGLVKVFLLSYALQSSAEMFAFYRTNSPYRLWFELVLFALYFFLNFSGYSDLAIGAAKILGFELKRNFDWPYIKTNPQDFWNSWHMSLTHFFQRNVFVPFGGMRPKTQYRAIFLTIMAIAMWHDISISLAVFGLYHAAGLMGHRWLRARRPPREAPPRTLVVAKAGANFMYVAVSLPLIAIQSDQIVPFYSALLRP
jgi:alginate O-acetyltransferase complex protein AlgI